MLVAGASQLEGNRETEIGDKWKRMRRIDRKRGQNGKYLIEKKLFEPDHLGFRDAVRIDNTNTIVIQLKSKFCP